MEHLSSERAKALCDFLRRAQASTPRVVRVPLNSAGRDFVIGDVHGAFDEVREGMKAVDFDISRDRLFSVGDLVDRGAASHRANAFLKQPYVFSIRGNHENDLVELYRDSDNADIGVEALAHLNFHGMRWLDSVSAADRAELVERFARLPLAIEIQTPRGTVGLVHGEVPHGMAWGTFLTRLEAGDEAVITSCLEGRRRIEDKDASGVPGVGRIYCGHSIRWEGAQRLGNVWAIDTGAMRASDPIRPRGALTIAEMACATVSLSEQRAVGKVRILDVAAEADFDAPVAAPRRGFPIRPVQPIPAAVRVVRPFGDHVASPDASDSGASSHHHERSRA